MHEWEPPPLTKLERMVLDCGYPTTVGLDTAADKVRRWLRAEIDRQAHVRRLSLPQSVRDGSRPARE